ncbi:Retrovirus-related Pol polyprotein from transposon RE2 [Vitis vinifera]|uniref:Retrovirus-related Pol polyprotein from transposon RE2 n=1 Tax=Vitis vinifera TaxID=29760 RepID=A0A438FSB6_VITVI|nr:Retrovirus-related Pol polyprotein from transposon RE2 [Vitis vinifera]
MALKSISKALNLARPRSYLQWDLNPDFVQWRRFDRMVLSWMYSTLNPDIMGQIVGFQTSHEAWMALHKIFFSSKARIMQLRLEFQTTKKGGDSMLDYILKMKTISDNLAAVGNRLLTAREDDLSLHSVHNILLTHEQRLHLQHSSLQIFLLPLPIWLLFHPDNHRPHQPRHYHHPSRPQHQVSSSSNRPPTRFHPQQPRNITQYPLLITNHIIYLHVLNANCVASSVIWLSNAITVLTSTIKATMVFHLHRLLFLMPCLLPHQIIKILSSLTLVQLTTLVILLKLSLVFSHIQDQVTKKILLKGWLRDGLYEFSSSFPLINKIAPCIICPLAKSHSLPYSLSSSHASHPLALIHTDLWGPAPSISITGARYFLIFIDDYSRHTWIYFLSTRTSLTMVENSWPSNLTLKLMLCPPYHHFRFYPSLIPVPFATSSPAAPSPPPLPLNTHPMAMNREYQALLRNNTWSLVPPPSSAHIVGYRWIYKLKYHPDGSIDRHKAHLVAPGHFFFIFHTASDILILLVYVDDILVTGSSPTLVSHFISYLSAKFALQDLGPLWRLRNQLPLQVISVVPFLNLMMFLCRIHQNIVVIVGALQYVTLTKPDIAFVVKKACQFMAKPSDVHWMAVKRILRYLKGTIHLGLHFQPAASMELQGYSDADWASCPNDHRSTNDYCVFLGLNLISWSSSKQRLVSKSSAESEYRGLVSLTAELVWIQSLLQELCLPTSPPILWCDNQSAAHLAANPVFHSHSKHIELDLHFIREKVLRQELQI